MNDKELKPTQVLTQRKDIIDFLESHKGKITRFSFIKKDGSRRDLIGILGVKKYLKGGKATVSEEKFFIPWEIEKKEYRAVSKETLFEVKYGGTVYKIID